LPLEHLARARPSCLRHRQREQVLQTPVREIGEHGVGGGDASHGVGVER
jgi:hypothetical protein